MYYSSGNYEAFARPLKPEGVDQKSAYLVGSGLASLAAACFLIRDGQMKGDHIHILEELALPGGACDGIRDDQKGFVIRGGRELESHMECLWDLFRSIPSIETEGVSVLDEFYWLDKRDPNYSLMRATINQGEDAQTGKEYTLTEVALREMVALFLTPDASLYDTTIDDVFGDEFYASNFWLYWQTMFAFEKWHSALEMKLYMQRFVHHIGGLPDFSVLKFTRYNQYESFILPLVHYLQSHGVHFQYETRVTNVLFDMATERKMARQIVYVSGGKEQTIELTEDDLVFVTNGSCTENSTLGDNDHAPIFDTKSGEGAVWDLWRNIASQDRSFGHPEKFCSDVDATNWESATVTTLDDRIPPYVENVCKRDPFSGKVTTGGIITVRDSNWLMSYTFSRFPHFKEQPKDQLVGWIYGLYTSIPGNFVKKPMKECTGIEICMEWLYHLGVPVDQIEGMATKSASTIPCMMPYITAFFMPVTEGDRPKVVPDGCTNFAFIGQFAQTERDTVFTTEYSVRTAMEAVYTLLGVDRGVPEVFASRYDYRTLLYSASMLLEGKKLTDESHSLLEGFLEKKLLKSISGTVIEEELLKYNLI